METTIAGLLGALLYLTACVILGKRLVAAQGKGGAIRICGDYKLTANKVAPLDSYPIPNTVDQLATLAGGDKFTKLDLSQAYQELQLDEKSSELLTINTHQGLYQPSRLHCWGRR